MQNSPRKRIHIQLPDEPRAQTSGTWAQLALLVVAVNIVACLIASRGLSVAETAGIAAAPPLWDRQGNGPAILAPFRR